MVHWAIHGYSRMITYLKCANNNRSSTVLIVFCPNFMKFQVGLEETGVREHYDGKFYDCIMWNRNREFYMWTKCS